MKQYRLTVDDKKQIAHFIAQKSITTIATGQPKTATEEYLQVFNSTLEQLDKYNASTID